MIRSKLRAALLATTVAAAVVAPAAAASAASTTVKDGTGDVWESTYDDTTQTESFTAAGSVVNVDLVSSTISHGPSRFKVTMHYADLKKVGSPFYPALQMRFDSGPKRVAFIDTSAGWRGKHLLFKNGKQNNSQVTCSGFSTTIAPSTCMDRRSSIRRLATKAAGAVSRRMRL